MPESETVWGLPTSLSVTVNCPARAPIAEGLKLIIMVQVPPDANDVPQLLFSVKSAALAPDKTILEIVRAGLPELLRVTA